MSGNMGDSSISSPPKPHPMSANSTLGWETEEDDGTRGAAEDEASVEAEEGAVK